MSCNAYPVKLLNCYLNINCKPEQLASNPLACIATVKLDSPSHLYPLAVNNTTVYATGRFETTLAGPELKFAIDNGHCILVKDIAEYKLAAIFGEYVNKLWQMRLDFIDSGNEPMAKATKLLLNSLYGKFGQRSSALVYTPSFLPPIKCCAIVTGKQ